MNKKEYFSIEISHLLEKCQVVYPFNIYLGNLNNENVVTFLPANSPLSKEKIDELTNYLIKGAILLISRRQKLTFLKNQNIEEQSIPSLKIQVDPIEIQREQQIENIKNSQPKIDGITFKNAIANEDFNVLKQRMVYEISQFNLRISHTVSLARFLTLNHLDETSSEGKTAILSYSLARILGIQAQSQLAQLICAALFHHLGFLHLNRAHQMSKPIELAQIDYKDYQKHPGLSQHLLKRSNIEIDEEIITIINQHHERSDGLGYPLSKKDEHIHPMAKILAFCSFAIEYSSGKINGQICSVATVVKKINNQSADIGLEKNFSDYILKSVSQIFDQDSEIKKSA